MDLMVKNVKTLAAVRNGVPWTCSLYLDGDRIARVQEEGNGGSLWFDYINKGGRPIDRAARTALVARLTAHAEAAHAANGEDWKGEAALEILVGEMVEDVQDVLEARNLKRHHNRGNVVWRNPENEKGVWNLTPLPKKATAARRGFEEGRILSQYPEAEIWRPA